MTTSDAEAKLRAHVQAAVEAGPAPDRGRLARIEQGLTSERRPATRLRWSAVALAAAAATATGAYWAIDRPEPPAPSQPSGGAEGTESAAQDDTDEDTSNAEADAAEPAGNDEEQTHDGRSERDDPVIYQR